MQLGRALDGAIAVQRINRFMLRVKVGTVAAALLRSIIILITKGTQLICCAPYHQIDFIGRFTLEHDSAIYDGKGNNIMQKTPRCCICKRHSYLSLFIKKKEYLLCKYCDDNFFRYQSQDEKEYRLENAIQLSREHNINWGLALNVTMNRYTLKEAKRRNSLKKREKSGKSVDAYVIGRKLPGGLWR